MADVARMRAGIVLARLVREDRDQASVARVEVEMALVRPAQVRLLEKESHSEEPLPEIDGALAGGSHQRDVMDALHLNARHEHDLRVGMAAREWARSIPAWPRSGHAPAGGIFVLPEYFAAGTFLRFWPSCTPPHSGRKPFNGPYPAWIQSLRSDLSRRKPRFLVLLVQHHDVHHGNHRIGRPRRPRSLPDHDHELQRLPHPRLLLRRARYH